MAPSNPGRSAAHILGAIIILILSGTFLIHHDVTSQFTTSLAGRSLSDTVGFVASGFATTTSATAVKAPSSDLVAKRAVPFGYETALDHGLLRLINGTQNTIAKRVITFPQAVANGRNLLGQLSNGGGNTRRAVTLDDLTGKEHYGNGQTASLGWTYSQGGGGGSYIADYRRPYNELNIPGTADANPQVSLDQDQEFENCGALHQPTSGINEAIYNVAGKAIVSTFNFSPVYRLRRRLNVARLSTSQALGLPRITFWSDIVWTVWEHLTHNANEASALKYIFKHDVVTPDTVFVIEQILGLGDDQFPADNGGEWPGFEFLPGQNNFLAMVGTPHGRGIVSLIMDHRSSFELGGKSIESIRVFRGDDGADQWHILFTLTGPGNAPLAPSQMVPESGSESGSDSGSDNGGGDSDSEPPSPGGKLPN